ncbi:MAG TPA: transposase, partial [Candidatus Dojkabacteria bacterium]|nr:transposase [Candidatus Dojkabacteria bacterium]
DSTFRYLPSYSPQLNPIEEVFGAIKHQYKTRKVAHPEKVIPTVIQSVQTIQAKTNLLNYYRNAARWDAKAFRGDMFDT